MSTCYYVNVSTTAHKGYKLQNGVYSPVFYNINSGKGALYHTQDSANRLADQLSKRIAKRATVAANAGLHVTDSTVSVQSIQGTPTSSSVLSTLRYMPACAVLPQYDANGNYLNNAGKISDLSQSKVGIALGMGAELAFYGTVILLGLFVDSLHDTPQPNTWDYGVDYANSPNVDTAPYLLSDGTYSITPVDPSFAPAGDTPQNWLPDQQTSGPYGTDPTWDATIDPLHTVDLSQF